MSASPAAFLALVSALMLAGCAANTAAKKPAPPAPAVLEATQCGTIQRVHALGDFLFTSQPAREDFALAKDAGVRTVLNFRHRSELPPDFDEKTIVEGLGMTYVWLPWSGEDQLTDEIFDQGRDVLTTGERPMLVHCASANRVGAIVLVWRVLDHGVPFDQALDEAQRIGMKTPGFERRARAYIASHAK